MANIDLKFIDFYQSDDFIQTEIVEDQVVGDLIIIRGFDSDMYSTFRIYLDKSTAIKFAKTLRTEINKIK